MVVLKKTTVSLAFLLLRLFAVAQYKVSFVVTQLPSYQLANDRIYLAGSFNKWNPHDENFVLNVSGGQRKITLQLPKGQHEFKFTRGSWERAECDKDGVPVGNRTIAVESDTAINVKVQDWADHFPSKKILSSANKNVHIIDTSFYIPQLDRKRRVWIYLPAGYNTARKKYPVLYMNDGQNVFDNATSGFGEWGVDEALDTLGPKNKDIIVVAVDHGSAKRNNEYSPFETEKFGKGEGNEYVDFLAKTLKPYIDKHYRTKKDEKNTFIAGSSMGGLISFYAILKYPKVFGSAGVFSPSFWIAPGLKNIIAEQGKKVKGRIYFFAGQHESGSMIPDMLSVFEQMRKYSKAQMKTVIKAEGIHNEVTWREAFPDFYKYLTQ